LLPWILLRPIRAVSHLVIAGLDPAVHTAVKRTHVRRLIASAAPHFGLPGKPGGDGVESTRMLLFLEQRIPLLGEPFKLLRLLRDTVGVAIFILGA
jgi:hypothetical protein